MARCGSRRCATEVFITSVLSAPQAAPTVVQTVVPKPAKRAQPVQQTKIDEFNKADAGAAAELDPKRLRLEPAVAP